MHIKIDCLLLHTFHSTDRRPLCSHRIDETVRRRRCGRCTALLSLTETIGLIRLNIFFSSISTIYFQLLSRAIFSLDFRRHSFSLEITISTSLLNVYQFHANMIFRGDRESFCTCQKKRQFLSIFSTPFTLERDDSHMGTRAFLRNIFFLSVRLSSQNQRPFLLNH